MTLCKIVKRIILVDYLNKHIRFVFIFKVFFEYIISTLQFITILILSRIIIREFIYNYIYLGNIKSENF